MRRKDLDIGITSDELGNNAKNFSYNLKEANACIAETNYNTDRKDVREIPAMLNTMDDSLAVLDNMIYKLTEKLEVLYSVIPDDSEAVLHMNLHCDSPLAVKMLEQIKRVKTSTQKLIDLYDAIEL